MSTIPELREKIDKLDAEIVRLLNERANCAAAIGQVKRESGGAIYEPDREQTVYENVRAANDGPLAESDLLVIYERVMDVMRSLQRRSL